MTPSPPSHERIAHLAELLWGYHLTRALWLASYLILVYDWLITLDDEVSCMWGWPLTRRQVLYFINRYWPMINLFPNIVGLFLDHPALELYVLRGVSHYLRISTHRNFTCSCAFQYAWFTFANLVTQITTTLILILRLYAMYGRNKRLLVFLLVLQGLTFTSQGILSSFLSSALRLKPISRATGCLPGGWDLHPWVYGVPSITLDVSLFGLIAAKTIQHYVDEQHDGTPRIFTTFSTLLLDNTIYFLAVLGVIGGNFLAYFVGGPIFYIALPETLPVFYSIIGCRMLINVKKAASPRYAEPWRNTETAVFEHALHGMSFFLRSEPRSPTLFEPPSSPPLTESPQSPVATEGNLDVERTAGAYSTLYSTSEAVEVISII